ncbi:MAG: phospholipase D-like domain-containing protein [Steroidobacteraceae bacterium]
MIFPRRLGPARLILLALAGVWIGTAIWHVNKPLPPGTHVAGQLLPVHEESLQLLTDVTYVSHGEQASRQSIHAATLELVLHAQHFLVLDFFLFNDQGGPAGPIRYERGLHPVASELAAALRELRQRQPQLPILVLVDPINDYYRGTVPAFLAALAQPGVDIVATNLAPLRDSNPVYSTTWRLLAGWWLKPGGTGGWSNRLDAAGPDVPLGALLRIPQFKANHRKVAITATVDGALRGIVSSGNPHAASSAHSNVALRLEGEALRPLLASTLAIAKFSGWDGSIERFFLTAPPGAAVSTTSAAPTTPIAPTASPSARAAIVTEGAIREQLLQRLSITGTGDAIDIAMFYLSDRRVINALLAAARRGAAIRVLLDPNKDAFGFEKSGIPNRQVAAELMAASDGKVRLRWFRTHGEQFHTKLTAVHSSDRLWLMLGSANFTRRNLGDYNLEANVIVDVPASSRLATEATDWFEMLWTNRSGATQYSADANVYAEPGAGRYWLYRFMEASGFSTF